jgi:HSP20 family protein
MAEVTVVKQNKSERVPTRLDAFETPFFRGNLFNVNPFTLMRQFTEEMDRVFAQAPRGVEANGAWNPAIEVRLKDGKFLVNAELPGVKNEDVKVHIDGNALIVEGERRQEIEEKKEGYYHSERSYGNFYRSVALPEGAVIDQATAQFNNGVLEVTVPVPEAKTARKDVPVEVASKKAA